MKKGILLGALLIAGTSFAQDSKMDQDRNAIKSMCGCYEVKFNFSETFSYSDDSTYTPSPDKHSGGLEWVQLVEDEEGRIVMQHLLIVGSENDPIIIKHWRQDWLFENTDLYTYNHDNKWTFQQFSKDQVAGQWTQKVYQVDDSPRYEGSASWVHVDGKSYWENTTDAPLPRREYTQRSDYNVTVRGNRHEITKDGWIHDQDNQKVIRAEGKEDVILAEEKGYNTYTKVADFKCQAAQDWWAENHEFWSAVRDSWDEIFESNQNVELAHKVDGKALYEILFDMDPKSTKPKKVDATIKSFVQ
ncbi:MAG: hypothetical protein DCO96_02735 [Fluviicola sp. XM-24bin1]|nr:MAG: hypothetical protein DCO96_02735 [Fluviicola sp. XM-24bin1]